MKDEPGIFERWSDLIGLIIVVSFIWVVIIGLIVGIIIN